RGVSGAAAGNDEFPKVALLTYGDHESGNCLRNGSSGQRRRCRDHIRLSRASAHAQELLHELSPELLTSGSLRRLAAKERPLQNRAHDGFENGSGGGYLSIRIKLAVEKFAGDS